MSVSPISASYTNQHLTDAYTTKHNSSSGEANPSPVKSDKSNSVLRHTVKTEEAKKTNFLEQLLNKSKSTNKGSSVAEMQLRLVDIKKLGITLRHHPEPSMVKSYVSEVKNFLDDLRDKAYQGHKSPEDLFEKINIVDKHLDKLADDFLSSQKNEFALVNSLGVLEGLLVDILV